MCSFDQFEKCFTSSRQSGNNMTDVVKITQEPLTSPFVLGAGISIMALVYEGSISIAHWMTINSNSFFKVAPNTNLLGLNLRSYFATDQEIFLKSTR